MFNRQVNPRRAFYAATWLAGTLLATAIVYGAVAAVADQVTAQRSESLSQAAVDQALKRSSPRPAQSPSSQSPSPSTSASPVPPQSTPTPGLPPPTSRPTAAAGASRTFSLVGGTTSVSCRSGVIGLDWATPNSGFWVETGSSQGGAQIEVRFRSDTHDSRLEAWCAGGTVQSSVREEGS